jgi:Carboxypeptidase regulatory-like domain
MRGLMKPLLLSAAFLLVAGTAYAQVGAIAGTVRDASGGVMPGVNVEVTSPALIEKVRSTVTDDNGRYQITVLPVGTYKVTFALQGFSTVERDNVNLTSDFTAPVNAQLAVGNIAETVSVVAESPSVDVQNAKVQYVFKGDEIADLPTERDLGGLLNLVPSVTTNQGNCVGGIGAFCNGIAPAFNSHVSANDADGQNQGRIVVDGMTINRGAAPQGINLNTGATNGIAFDTANVQELTFTLSGALGESETGGATITIVPRTGGNRFAGTYFSSYTNDGFFDRNRGTRLSTTPATQDLVKDFDVNGSFGGPIKRNRLWFFVQGRTRGDEKYPNGGTVGGFANLNEGQFAANYQPLRGDGTKDSWLTYTSEQKNLALRLTLQASQRNKFNMAWDEQDACTNPCKGMINIVDSPESYFSLQNRPNRLRSVSWTNPFTNKILFEAGITAVNTKQDSTRHREYTNRPELPRICEQGSTTGMDSTATKVNTTIRDSVTANGGAGACSIFDTMISGSINEAFANNSGIQVLDDDTYRTRATASYVTGSHNAKIGFEGAYFSEGTTNVVNDMRLAYHYGTPDASCLTTAPTAANPYPCGNMTLQWAASDPFNTLRRPRPIGFDMNTGLGTADERVWFGALYLQDQWTLKRFTISGALRYDHAQSRYGETCIGPDRFVPVQADGKNFWCSEPAKGVSYNDITPRWAVAWDLFGTGKTSIKWNMGKYLQAAGFGGNYTDNNSARRSTNQLTRAWDDVNGNRIVECDFLNPAPHTSPAGDVCGTLLQPNGEATTAFQTFGRGPTAAQLFTANSFCGRTENSSQLHRDYCAASGQNLMSGMGVRRSEWQFGLGVQHEILPRLSAEVTYNHRKYYNLTDSDTVGLNCDYFLGADVDQCIQNAMNFVSPHHDFYSFRVPSDPRLPNGGGYVIKGVANQKNLGALPGAGNVTTIQNVLDYTWGGVDTNFVYRGPGGLRISGGTSIGRSLRDTCAVDGDIGLVGGVQSQPYKGREGNLYGGGCKIYNPYQLNARASGSYTIPWVDVLAGVAFQSRPGNAIAANLNVPYTAAVWEPASASRTGTMFNGNVATATQTVNLLDFGDLYGERTNNWDVTLRKNIRFAGKRLNFGVDVYNVFNSDAATTYNQTYTAFLAPNGSWVSDDPATPAVETNTWGDITQLVNPRFMRLSLSLNF